MLEEKIIDLNSIWVNIQTALDRISYHSQKNGGTLQTLISTNKTVFDKARVLVNKFSDTKSLVIGQTELEDFLGELKELQPAILFEKIGNNNHYTVIEQSFADLIYNFDQLIF